MTDRTDERIRSVVVELAEHAPVAPTFDELEHLAAATTTEARPRRRGAVVAGAVAVAGIALVVSVVVARSDDGSGRVRTGRSSTTTTTIAAPRADALGFRRAPGWRTVMAPTGSATAANISLGPDTAKGYMPWDTVERLEAGDVVLYAVAYPTGKPLMDANFPKRELPLSLDDATHDISFEGQPAHIYADRLDAQVDGWNIDLLVFYGGGDPTAVPPTRAAPSARTRAAAQAELERLVLPARG
jgi:hypothetical protein